MRKHATGINNTHPKHSIILYASYYLSGLFMFIFIAFASVHVFFLIFHDCY